MTVEFDRTAHCQYNHQRLTEFQRILTEQFWLCFDRTTIPTEHLRKLGFDRTVNWKIFCQKNALLGILCHIYLIPLGHLRLLAKWISINDEEQINQY